MDPFFANEEKLVRVLFRNVSNAGEIIKLVIRAGLPLCLIKPKFIVGDFQLSVAITKALYNKRDNRMTTKTFPTELIYCLSPTKNISESLKIFRTEDGDTEFIIVGEEALYLNIKDSIRGEEVDMEELKSITDLRAVAELYQIPHEELVESSLLDSVVTRMATKEYNL